jgi:hypothetical protein
VSMQEKRRHRSWHPHHGVLEPHEGSHLEQAPLCTLPVHKPCTVMVREVKVHWQ